MTALVAVTVSAALAGCGQGLGGVSSERGNDEALPRPAVSAEGRADEVEASSSPAAAKPPRGSEDWRMTRPAEGRIAAYTTLASAPAGARVGVKVSTTAAGFRLSAYRIGAYPGGTGTLVWRSGFLPGRVQPSAILDPVETRTVVAPWARDLTLDTTDWTPGFYVLKLRTGSGWETLVPYVVSSTSADGTVALVAPVTTWQSYNQWGGYSLYAGPDGDRRSWAVSFDRPYNGATGANDYRTAAIPVVVRAEALGIPLSYFTNVDLHTRPHALDGARGYVSMGHDEYWTPAMRHQVTQARDAGTNLAFLGANTMYWRIRLEDRATGPARLQVGYRDDAALDPVRDERPEEATSRFRDGPAGAAERDLLGMDYECYPVDADFVVTSPSWWGFAGTGLHAGDRLPHLIGPEADRVYPSAGTPRPMEILSHTTYDCRGVTTSAQSVYYSAKSGAGVFTAGTLRWGCAIANRCDVLLDDRVSILVRRVTDNVLNGFAAGPVGANHRARDNVDRFDLSPVNSVTAS